MIYTYKGEQVILYGIFQHSEIMEPSMGIGGHNGGQVAYPVAVIECENGDIQQIKDIYNLKRNVQKKTKK